MYEIYESFTSSEASDDILKDVDKAQKRVMKECQIAWKKNVAPPPNPHAARASPLQKGRRNVAKNNEDNTMDVNSMIFNDDEFRKVSKIYNIEMLKKGAYDLGNGNASRVILRGAVKNFILKKVKETPKRSASSAMSTASSVIDQALAHKDKSRALKQVQLERNAMNR